ncbi:MAG TPA: tetratricopeptide repeat protein [Thermoanaerobaculia bacterium]|nr:tetratricopeptide repeat protein [Thermoanaerobaculia bacterium]
MMNPDPEGAQVPPIDPSRKGGTDSSALAFARAHPLYIAIAAVVLLIAAAAYFLKPARVVTDAPHASSATGTALPPESSPSFADRAAEDPGYVALVNSSLDLYKRGQFAESISAAKRALRINPQGGRAYNNICAAYAAQRMWDEAIEACNAALAIDPAFELAKNNLAWAKAGKQGK